MLKVRGQWRETKWCSLMPGGGECCRCEVVDICVLLYVVICMRMLCLKNKSYKKEKVALHPGSQQRVLSSITGPGTRRYGGQARPPYRTAMPV